jgi:hypothetical protein
MAAVQGAISKRRKFVADGVFYAELNEFFQRELAEEGYSGVEVRVTPTVTDISTSQPRTQTYNHPFDRRIGLERKRWNKAGQLHSSRWHDRRMKFEIWVS